MTADLVAFLRVRLDEDERAARAALGAPWIRREGVAGVHSDSTDDYPHGAPIADCRRIQAEYEDRVAVAEHIVRHQPARVLAEVAAKRQMIDDTWGGPDQEDVWLHHVRLLALPYADHPDYREEWRP
ncbi:DUF6221 family protein [Streptomyces mobaraensis]|uniref:Uncharacterized protein n=1 Tax=Streptomyces mobaraensis TaxID=35621 RepID=A0A5N5WD07_STRMB|nr:DUF6221 family protein [Streptomyces mobaraensis]KAB7850162.1 hypothetical protein FRZ00_06075 [Streptomyces mobaraensis]